MVRETYVETVHELIEKNGVAAVTDIAKALNVKPSSVTEMLKKLYALGFVEYTPYGILALTKKGENLAAFLKRTRLALQSFLRLFGMDEQTAREDACKIKHIIHELTLERISLFVVFVQTTSQVDIMVNYFKKYYNTKV
jgi:DtxR family transcriptional regulator, Mn-dependent transcriptional regulator